MAKSSKAIFWLVGLGMILAGLGFIFIPASPPDDRGYGQEVAVRTVLAERTPFTDTLESLGTATAKESVQLTARVSESVEAVYFTDGQYVTEGTVLVELTRDEEQAQFREAQANLTEAQSQYDRVQGLVGSGNATETTLDQRLRALMEARSRLAVAEARLADRIIRAPFSGVLGVREVSPGTLVAPGTVVATLDDTSVIKLDFFVPERFISLLEDGLVIQAVSAAFAGETFDGTITNISSRVDRATRTVTVRAEIQNPDGRLLPGMLMTVRLESDPRVALAVPAVAIVPVGDQKFVYRVDANGLAERVEVLTGTRIGRRIEILEGLNHGDEIVYSGTLRLRPGVTLRIVSQDPFEEVTGSGSASQ